MAGIYCTAISVLRLSRTMRCETYHRNLRVLTLGPASRELLETALWTAFPAKWEPAMPGAALALRERSASQAYPRRLLRIEFCRVCAYKREGSNDPARYCYARRTDSCLKAPSGGQQQLDLIVPIHGELAPRHRALRSCFWHGYGQTARNAEPAACVQSQEIGWAQYQ